MGQSIGTLVANLVAETASFHQDLGKATQALNSNAAAMNRSLATIERQFKSLNTIAGSVLTVGLAKSFIGAAKQSLEFADSIGEMARKVGLGTSALQELQYVQMQSGGSTESFNAGMLRFTQTIGDAANGSKQAVDALAKVGISVDDLRRKNMEQLYIQASNAIAKMADEGKRAAAIQDNFGKVALESANAFGVASDEIAALRQQALATGQVLDETTIQNAKKAKDEMEAFSRAISIQLTQSFVQVGPLLVKGAELIANVAEMAGWAARRIGLLSDVTMEQKYQSLLEKGLDIRERIAFLETKIIPGTVGGSMLDELEQLRTELPIVEKQILDMNDRMSAAKKDVAGPGSKPAISGDIAPIGGTATESEYAKLLQSLTKQTDQYNADALKSEAAQSELRRKISMEEWQFKADQARLSTEQMRTFQEALSNLDLARAAKEKKAAELKLEGIIAQNDVEYALYIEQRDRLMEIDDTYAILGLERDQQYADLRAKVFQDTEAKKGNVFAQMEQQRAKVAQMNWQQQLVFTNNALGSISNLMNSESKSQFEIGKKAAIAQASIAAVTAAIEAYKSASAIPFVGWILGPIAGAAALAAGMSNVSKIKSTQFGGTSGGSFSAASPSVPLSPEPQTPIYDPSPSNFQGTRGERARDINVTLKYEGAPPTDEWVRDHFAPVLERAVRDGASNLALQS